MHLVKAAFKKQFELAMIKNGVSADFYFKKVNLPTIDIDPESLLPEKPFWHLINMVALNENIPDFGSQVAQTTPWHKVLSLAPLIHNSVSLKNLLEKFCMVAGSQSSSVEFSLIDNESTYTFCYADPPFYYKNDIQMELYRISCMIQFVQLSAGSEWRPEEIQLIMPENMAVESCDLLKKSKITFSNKVSSITIERKLLNLPVNINIPDNLNAVHSEPYDINTDFANAIRNIMSVYVQNQCCAIEQIASIADISVRTLQRRLTEHGLKFNDLLNQAKFIYAKEKLQNSQMPIAEIARILGYSDAANFSRSFNRWAGISPREYRQQNMI